MVTTAAPDPRVEADLNRHLGALTDLYGYQFPPVSLRDSLPEIVAIIDQDPGAEGCYVLDVPALRRRQPVQEAAYADLVVQFRDRPGQELRGRLENAPAQVASLDPDDPPYRLS